MSDFLDRLDIVLAAAESGRLPLLQRNMARHQRAWLVWAQRQRQTLEPAWDRNCRAFVTEVYPRLCIFGDVARDDLPQQVDEAIALVWCLPEQMTPEPWMAAALDLGEPSARESLWRGLRPARYAIELGLLVPDGTRMALSRAGEAVYGLIGRDRIRLLLTLEILQSAGTEDRWRISKRWLDLVTRVGCIDNELMDPWDSYHADLIRAWLRLEALGLLTVEQLNGPEVAYGPASAATQAMLAPLVADEPGPIHGLARALLADEQTRLFGDPGGRSATDAALDQVRVVAHELCNIALPMSQALGRLTRGAPEPDFDILTKSLDRIRRFADSMSDTARLITAHTTFPVVPAMQEAIAEANVESGRTAELDVANVGEAHVTGDRRDFIHAILNLLRNAWQARPDARVHLPLLVTANGYLRIAVDDDGPGVPKGMREVIFDDGVSTRDDGTGMGLAFVKKTIERMGSSISCQDSPLGGARFLIEMPIKGGIR